VHDPQRQDFRRIVRQLKVLQDLQTGFISKEVQDFRLRLAPELRQQGEPVLSRRSLEGGQLVRFKGTQDRFRRCVG
jgi:hypothetical protein